MKKSILQWFREILGNRGDLSDSIPSGNQDDEVRDLIGRITFTDGTDDNQSILTSLKNALKDERENEENSVSSVVDMPSHEESDRDTKEEEGEKSGKLKSGEEGKEVSCCPFSFRRNLVVSIREIERFAADHRLAAEIIKALITALAEMTLDAMKGKVNGTVLLLLLNAMNFNKAKEEAYREGEIAGRNSKIEEKYFPSADDGIPHFRGMKEKQSSTGIFSLARNA
ncbi:MAG: hypothetical protein J1E95_08160 [Muribaculaceae bacterium]|nr:hypothetical protein [Muribaculaceae bacterium]